MMEVTRRGLFATGAALAFGAMATEARAAAGGVSLKLISGGFIFGASVGEGVLTFQGRRYPLVIGGLSAGLTVGLGGAELIGEAHHLRSPRDIAGVYSKLGVDTALPNGRSVQDLVNPNGVTLRLHGRETGFIFSVDLSGMTLALK